MKKRGQKSEISGGVLIFFGVVIVVLSLVINLMTEKNFVVFMVVGAGMAAFGVLKPGTRPKKNKELSLETMQKKYSKQQEVMQKQQQQMQKQMMEQLKQQQQMQAQHQQMRQHHQQMQSGQTQQRPQPQHTRYPVRK